MDRFLNTETDPNLLSPLDLAFLGDCVYELFVREKLVTEANRPNRDLHAALQHRAVRERSAHFDLRLRRRRRRRDRRHHRRFPEFHLDPLVIH